MKEQDFMKNRYRKRSILIICILTFCFLYSFDIFRISIYNLESSSIQSYCELQDGVLAGYSDVKAVFVFADGRRIERGSGERIVFLKETQEIDSTFKYKLNSFVFKTGYSESLFECTDKKSGNSLGKIITGQRFDLFGLCNSIQFEELIQDYVANSICQVLETKKEFIDISFNPKNRYSFTTNWTANQILSVSLKSIGETVVPYRDIRLRRKVNNAFDSIPFSTCLGADSLLHHEIVKSDRLEKTITIERYLNNGQMSLQAVFMDTVIYDDFDEKEFTMLNPLNSLSSSVDLFWYKKF